MATTATPVDPKTKYQRQPSQKDDITMAEQSQKLQLKATNKLPSVSFSYQNDTLFSSQNS
jgi:hypothetical protein